MSKPISRRSALAAGLAAGASLAMPRTATASTEAAAPAPQGESMAGVPFEPRAKVRAGVIGVGGRGQGLLNDLLHTPDVQVVALCDVVPDRLKESQSRLQRRSQPPAEEYGAKGPNDYRRLCARGDLDLVYVATPWDWHVPMAVAAMEGGAHVGVEVPVCTTVKDAWKLVDTSERTRRHCVILENCNYGQTELMALRMCRAGLFGELTHGEAAYIHDLRGILFADSGEGLWRRGPHRERNGNLYPTHGLGPVAMYLDILRGDRFESMVSFSSQEAALTEWGQKNLSADSAKRKETFVCGDMNTSILRTAMGRTVMLQHDVVTPRPYSRINLIQGTKGCFADYPPRIYVDGVHDHDWGSIEPYRKEFEHPLWQRLGDLARETGGHGGMDYLMTYRLIECMKKGLPPDMDVYDAATWSVPGPLSEASVRRGGAPQRFPDFTRGRWSERRVGFE